MTHFYCYIDTYPQNVTILQLLLPLYQWLLPVYQLLLQMYQDCNMFVTTEVATCFHVIIHYRDMVTVGTCDAREERCQNERGWSRVRPLERYTLHFET